MDFRRNLAKFFFLTMIITLAGHKNLADAQFLLQDGLVSFWSFDADTIKGNKIRDAFGPNDCTAVKTPAQSPGKVGEALNFDGTKDGASCGNRKSLANIFDGGGTFMAWIFARSLGQNDQGRIGDKNQWTLMLRKEGRGIVVYIHADFDTTDGAWHTHPGEYELEQWFHAAMVYDSSSDKNDPLIYVNGESKRIIPKTAPVGKYTSDNDSIFGLAISFHDKMRFHDGLIDEVAIYNRALSDAEIRENYRAEGLAVAPADKLAITWGAIKLSR